MKINKKEIIIPKQYNKNQFLANKNLVFFDIETTGFSSIHSNLYLIGCIQEFDGKYEVIQWFAENPEEESLILHEFFQYIAHTDTLVHYNGTGFDIPYLEAKCKKYSLPYQFTKYNSFDLYKRISKFKNILYILVIRRY